MRCAFRVDSGHSIGVGHIKRCMALATALKEKGAEILFICRALDGHATRFLAAERFDYFLMPKRGEYGGLETHSQLGVPWKFDALETKKVLESWSDRIDWLIVDHYGIQSNWQDFVKVKVKNLFVIDDGSDVYNNCDLLLNPIGDNADYTSRVPSHCRVITGLEYALLHPSYQKHRPKNNVKNKNIERILIFFGGSDTPNLTIPFLKLLVRLTSEHRKGCPVTIDVVTTSTNQNALSIKEASSRVPFVHYHHDLPSLLPLLKKADFAIGGGGMTVLERLCLGVFSFVVVLAGNQLPLVKTMHELNALHFVGSFEKLDWLSIEQKVTNILCHGLTSDQVLACENIVDGAGARRVAQLIFERLTSASS